MTPAARPPGDRDELEGYLVGVARRAGEREADGTLDPRVPPLLAVARSALRRDDLAEADRALRAADAVLDEGRREMALVDRPRGLVGVRTLGDPGVPPGPEEEGLANRIRLIGRLATVRERAGDDVAEARRLLAEAQRAYDGGDRVRARTLVDAAHGLLETGGAEPP